MASDKTSFGSDGDLETMCSRFAKASQKSEIIASLRTLLDASPFDGALVAYYMPQSLSRLQVFRVSKGLGEWVQFVEETAPEQFPPAVYCARSVLPIDWQCVVQNDEIAEECSACKGLHGPLVPLHGPGIVFGMLALLSKSAVTSEQYAWWTSRLSLVTPHIVTGLQRVLLGSQSSPRLTTRERTCLMWAAEGKTNSEIGLILGISERTVRFHLCNVASKVRSNGRNNTVTKSIFTGVLLPGVDAAPGCKQIAT